MIPVHVEMMYDKPYAYHEDHPDASYESWYYTVRRLPDGEELSLAAYTGLNKAIEKTNYDVGTVLSIVRLGESKQTVWGVDYISGPRRSTNQSQAPAVAAVAEKKESYKSMSNEWEPLGEEAINVILTMVDDDLNLLEKTLPLVAMRPAFADATIDQQVRIARGSLIQADRRYRPGMTLKKDPVPLDQSFLADINNVDVDEIADAVINSVVKHTYFPEKKAVINFLISVGLSSAYIKEGSRDDLLTLFNICDDWSRMVYSEEVDEDAATTYVSDKYGMDVPDAPAF